MHEMAIAQSLAETIENQAAIHHATLVRGIRLQIGEAQSVVNDSLTFCFEMLASAYPLLEGASLEIETIPYRAHCPHCAQDFSIENAIRQCPGCQSWETEVISGTEMDIVSIEIETNTQWEEERPCQE